MDEVAACPACGIDVPTPKDVVVGEVLVCAHCGAEIEVISLAPILLEFFEEEEK
ncbi:MAG: lysine biosynthesis protein LysW [Ardenticatenales bacterium]|jgi:alpha-aminoadipate carrier protein LysW|nr:lysine biosynthesis protein LysW [Ardenticatenales bacterium]